MTENEKKEVTDKRSIAFKKEPGATVTVTSGKFPVHLFREWDKVCNGTFGGCRWMKMWHDHQVTQNMDMFRKLVDEIDALKEQIELIRKAGIKDETEVKTLGKEEGE